MQLTTRSEIAIARLRSQQLLSPKFHSAQELVSWMGAMQAQDPNMVKWGVGIRLPRATEALVEKAMDAGEILRTHALRPTWHLVAAADIYWILELSAPHIKAQVKLRHKELELTPQLLSRSNRIIEHALSDGAHLTRNELMGHFEKQGIDYSENRSSHFLLWAELEQLICSGVSGGKKQTYALLGERVPDKVTMSREESLAELARRYFSSHGPATVEDFGWWSGLPVADARLALQMNRRELCELKMGDQTYWAAQEPDITPADSGRALLLPAFDEYIISYRDRSAVLPADHHSKAVSNNGIFWPVFFDNSKITGTWKRAAEKEAISIELNTFNRGSKALLVRAKRAARPYGKFLGKKPLVKLV